MKKISIFSFIIVTLSSCITSRSIIFNDNIYNSNKEQVLFFTKKPIKEYDELAIVEIALIPKKEHLIYQKLKEQMSKNNFDAIIEIRSEVFATSYFLSSMKYVGIGIKYRN